MSLLIGLVTRLAALAFPPRPCGRCHVARAITHLRLIPLCADCAAALGLIDYLPPPDPGGDR